MINYRIKDLFLTFLILFFSSSLIGGSTVTINGEAIGHEGSTIFLMLYSDLYTKTLVQVASSKIDDEGAFQLFTEIDEIEYVCLRFDHLNAFLYLQPGKNYSLQMLPLGSGQSVSLNNKTKVPYLFTSLDDDDINKKIIEFNSHHDNFFKENYDILKLMAAPPGSHFKRELKGDSIQIKPSIRGLTSQQKLAQKLVEFTVEMDKKYEGIDNTFFQVHRKMVIADLHLQLNGQDKTLFDNYLSSADFHPKNPEYLNFTRSFYDKYFASYMFKWGDRALIEHLNNGDFESLLSLLKKDDFIANEELRQFVACHAIYETLNSKHLEKKGMYAILDKISEIGVSDPVKKMAYAVKRKMTKTVKGFPAYDFNLPNHLEEEITLSDLDGKHKLILFWNDRCSVCESEMFLMTKMYEKYKKHFEFISIGLEFKNEKMSDILSRKKDHKWIFLDGSENASLSEEYQIYSVPTFVLLDDNGNFLNAYAKKPSEGLEEVIYPIFQKKELKKKRNRRVGRK